MSTLPNVNHAPTDCGTFFAYMESVIDRLNRQGRVGSAKNYRTTLKRLTSFRHHTDIPMSEFTSNLIEDFSAWLRLDGVKSNSISFYMRILRAVYLRAVNQGLVEDKHPFRHAYTKIEKTRKRAINFEDIKRIKDLELPQGGNLDVARDIYLFLFYTRGMSFIDAAFLRNTDIKANEIIYCRHKTHRPMAIGINSHISNLITKYACDDSPFLLPVIADAKANTRLQYENALRRTNNALKKIAKLANLPVGLTTYTARHSWATIAKQKGVNTATISDALGHDSEKTTQIYLSSISTIEINKANDLILEGL